MVSEARKKASAKWDAANMVTLTCRARRELAAKYKAAAAARGTTVSAVMRRALDSLLQEAAGADDPSDTI